RHQHRAPPSPRLVRRRDAPPRRAPQLADRGRAHQARRARPLRHGEGVRGLRGRRHALRARALSPVGAAQGQARVRRAPGLEDRAVEGDDGRRPPAGGSRLHRLPRSAGRRARELRRRRARPRPNRPPRRLMRVCVVGSGGREHALAHVLARTADVVVTPGNPGIPGSTATPAEEIEADLYVIGPEAPLVEVLADAGVPTARYGAFTELGEALEFLKSLPGPYVVKTDGLAAGKGVLVTESLDEAAEDVRAKLSGSSFGDAGRTVVIEEGLSGPELSILAVCDGTKAVALAPAQDFKRALDGDAGPNTGGMGAYSPVPAAGRD